MRRRSGRIGVESDGWRRRTRAEASSPPSSSSSNGLVVDAATTIAHFGLRMIAAASRIRARIAGRVFAWTTGAHVLRLLRALVHAQGGRRCAAALCFVDRDLASLLLALHFGHDPIATHAQVEALHYATLFAFLARRYGDLTCVVVRATEQVLFLLTNKNKKKYIKFLI